MSARRKPVETIRVHLTCARDKERGVLDTHAHSNSALIGVSSLFRFEQSAGRALVYMSASVFVPAARAAGTENYWIKTVEAGEATGDPRGLPEHSRAQTADEWA